MSKLTINRLNPYSKYLIYEVNMILKDCKIENEMKENINVYLCFNSKIEPFKENPGLYENDGTRIIVKKSDLTKQEQFMYSIKSIEQYGLNIFNIEIPLLDDAFEYNYLIIELSNHNIIIGRYGSLEFGFEIDTFHYYNNNKIISYEEIEDPFKSLLLNLLCK